MKNYCQLVDILLSCPKIDVNNVAIGDSEDWGGNGYYTALAIACLRSNYEIVQKLLKKPGLDVNYKCGLMRRTAMHLAARNSDTCCQVSRGELEHC